MTWWKVACTACAATAGVCICVFTAGTATPLVASTVIGWGAGTGALGYLVGDKADQEAIAREKELLKDKRYENANNEVGKQENENNQTESLINEIVGKLNGSIPRQPHETNEYLNQQLVIAQNKHKVGKERLNRLRSDLDKLRKELGGSQSLATLLGLDKLGFTDKIMIVGGIVLIIYLLKS